MGPWPLIMGGPPCWPEGAPEGCIMRIFIWWGSPGGICDDDDDDEGDDHHEDGCDDSENDDEDKNDANFYQV